MSTTIRAVLDGGEMKPLRGVVCGTTEPVMYAKGRQQDTLIKASIRDHTGFITLLVFNQLLFDLLKKAFDSKQVVKIDGYRRAETPNTVIVGNMTTCSILNGRGHSLTNKDITEARLAMYAPIQTMSQAKISPNKTRVSVKGKITKVLASNTTCKRVILRDVADQSESMVTIWQPQHTVQAEVGQAMALYDARASAFNGGSIDTSSGTLIEVSSMESAPKKASGKAVGFGFVGDKEVVEILIEGDEDETTFHMTDAVNESMKAMDIPANVAIEHTENVIMEVRLIDEVNEDELLNDFE